MLKSPDLERPKARQILDGARAAFLELGYEGASTDEITRRAGVSKGTLYNYFPDKKALFKAFVERECAAQAMRIIDKGVEAKTIEDALRVMAIGYVELMLSPFLMGIFRIVVAEAERFPELARVFYDSGPEIAHRKLSHILAAAVARNELKIDDIDLAAHQFAGLCRAELFFKLLFCIKQSFTREEMERIAYGAVDAFLKTYGTGARAAPTA